MEFRNKKRSGHCFFVIALAIAALTIGGEADAGKKSGKKVKSVACHQCVNSKSIKNNAVTTGKIKNNSITGKKLRNGSVTTNKLANGSVTASKLAPGAVLIPENIVYVSPSGGDYPDPQAARADLSSWCGTPSATNRCLIKILPGIYSLGGTAFRMVPYVSVEGSGMDVTILTGTIAGANTGVVRGANNSGLRHLTVSNTGGGSINNALYGYYMSSFDVRDVKLTASGATAKNRGAYFEGSGPTLTDVVATATGGISNAAIYLNLTSNAVLTRVSAVASAASQNDYGVYATPQSGTVAINDSELTATGGFVRVALFANTTSATVSVRRSVLSGTDYAIFAVVSNPVRVSHSELDGAVFPTTGSYTCAFNIDGSFAALDTDCQ